MERVFLTDKIGYHGGITYRFYPGCVECEIEYSHIACHETVKGTALIPPDETEHYDRVIYARLAFNDANRQIPTAEQIQKEMDKLEKQTS